MKECGFGISVFYDLHCHITLKNINLRHNKLLVNWRLMIPTECDDKTVLIVCFVDHLGGIIIQQVLPTMSYVLKSLPERNSYIGRLLIAPNKTANYSKKKSPFHI